MTNICEHGQLRRQCDKCELTAEIARLRSENTTLRNAQKACEHCGPNVARWEDGQPANIEAAAEDAYAWLTWLQVRSKILEMSVEQWDKLDRCMECLRGFMRPNAKLTGG